MNTTRQTQIAEAHRLLTRIASGVMSLSNLFDGAGGPMLDKVEEWAIHDWRQDQARLARLAGQCDADVRARICFALTVVLACSKSEYAHRHVGYFSRALTRLSVKRAA